MSFKHKGQDAVPLLFYFFCTHNALQLHEPTHFQSWLTPTETCNLSGCSLPASSIDRQEKTNWTVTRPVDTASPLCALHLRELSKLSTAFSFFFNSPTVLLPPTHELPRPHTVRFHTRISGSRCQPTGSSLSHPAKIKVTTNYEWSACLCRQRSAASH